MEIAKAIVLAGYADGERALPVAPGGVKHLMPVANRPILFHNLEALRGAGLLEATIAVDPREASVIRSAVDTRGNWQLAIRYSACEPGAGLLELLRTSRDFIGDEPVMIQDGGVLVRDHTHARITSFAREGLDGSGVAPYAPGPEPQADGDARLLAELARRRDPARVRRRS